MCPARAAPGRRVPNVQRCKAAAGMYLPPLYLYAAGIGQGFSPAGLRITRLCRLRRVRRLWLGCVAPAPLFSCRGHGGNRLPPPGRDGRRRAGIRVFRGFRMRVGQFVPRFGGEAVVRLGLCRHGCRCVGAVAGIRKFAACGRFFCPMVALCPAAIYPMTVATRRRPGARLRNSQR